MKATLKWHTGLRIWGVASMDIQCRFLSIYLVNDKLPEYRRGRDYMDDLGLTYRQAFNKAYKEVKPPSVTLPYVSYYEWRKKFSREE